MYVHTKVKVEFKIEFTHFEGTVEINL